jgi:hypothetical protein
MRFPQNKNEVRVFSVDAEDYLMLKLAYLFMDKKYNENSPLTIHELVCVERRERDAYERKRDLRGRDKP